MTIKHCNVCFLKQNHPGIHIDDKGICNLCKMEVPQELMANFKYTNQNYDIFQKSPPKANAKYDCLFMYSGGKDSTYMLDKFVNEEKRRVLAYTFNVPFESKHVEENIKKIQAKINIEYLIDSDDDKIKKMMQYVFNDMKPRQPGKYLDEKTPCMLCRTFFVIKAIIYAHKNNIPFIILCADPQQIITMESNVKETVKSFYGSIGRKLTAELFGSDIENILFASDDDLPRIVFPYIGMRHSYRPDQMIKELKEKDLYTSSPLETHCTLFPLLNYYSFKNYDCSFYKLNMSSQARNSEILQETGNATFGINFNSGPNMLDIEEKYKQVIFDLVAQQGTFDVQKQKLLDVFKQMDFDDDAANYLTDKFLSMRAIAEDLGIKI